MFTTIKLANSSFYSHNNLSLRCKNIKDLLFY